MSRKAINIINDMMLFLTSIDVNYKHADKTEKQKDFIKYATWLYVLKLEMDTIEVCRHYKNVKVSNGELQLDENIARQRPEINQDNYCVKENEKIDHIENFLTANKKAVATQTSLTLSTNVDDDIQQYCTASGRRTLKTWFKNLFGRAPAAKFMRLRVELYNLFFDEEGEVKKIFYSFSMADTNFNDLEGYGLKQLKVNIKVKFEEFDKIVEPAEGGSPKKQAAPSTAWVDLSTDIDRDSASGHASPKHQISSDTDEEPLKSVKRVLQFEDTSAAQTALNNNEAQSIANLSEIFVSGPQETNGGSNSPQPSGSSS